MLVVNRGKKIFLRFIDVILLILFTPRVFFHKKNKFSYEGAENILVLELWGLGDLALATAALRAIKKARPRASITLLAKPHARELFKNSSLPDKLIVYDFPWTHHRNKYHFWQWDIVSLKRLVQSLKGEGYSLAIDARMDFRNNLLMWLIGAQRRIGYDLTGGAYFLTDVVPFRKNVIHRVQAWEAALRLLDIDEAEVRPQLEISPDEEKRAKDFLVESDVRSGECVVGLHPGAGNRLRCWSMENFLDVANYLEKRYAAKVVVFVDPQGYGQELLKNGRFIRAKLGLREFIAVAKELRLLVCNDGGPMHLACAVNTPVLAIFGPGDFNIMGPYGSGHRMVCKKDVSCRPCRDYCRYKEAHCLMDIDVKDVKKVLDEMMVSLT